jgi:hypothetical protein
MLLSARWKGTLIRQRGEAMSMHALSEWSAEHIYYTSGTLGSDAAIHMMYVGGGTVTASLRAPSQAGRCPHPCMLTADGRLPCTLCRVRRYRDGTFISSIQDTAESIEYCAVQDGRLIFTDQKSGISSVSVDGGHISQILSLDDGVEVNGLDYDPRTSAIYFGDTASDTVLRCDKKGANLTEIAVLSASTPHTGGGVWGLAVYSIESSSASRRWGEDRIFVTSPDATTIRSMTLTGELVSDFVNASDARGVTVASSLGYLYVFPCFRVPATTRQRCSSLPPTLLPPSHWRAGAYPSIPQFRCPSLSRALNLRVPSFFRTSTAFSFFRTPLEATAMSDVASLAVVVAQGIGCRRPPFGDAT